ncbi:hypothetical protein BaRGS_00030839 [Batillaria attramentaria]|uniref:Fidgetin-like protein 1 n=1 Tax=Batillaria attramentaria TaxID=370345 RepID=A0ABD0JTC6_9CAEN
MSLCSQSRNESQNWTSCFASQSHARMDFVAEFIKRCENESSTVFPTGSTVSSLSSCDATTWQQPLIKAPASHDGRNTGSIKHQTAPRAAAQEIYRPSAEKTPLFKPHHTVVDGCLPQEETHRKETTQLEETTNCASEKGPSRSFGSVAFRTAREQFVLDQCKKHGQDRPQTNYSYGSSKKSLGTRRGPNNRFVPPVLNKENDSEFGARSGPASATSGLSSTKEESAPTDVRLKGIEPKIIELITNEIMDHRPQMDWEDIAGLQFAKKTIKEIVVWPMLRPDIFTGLRGPPKGLLLFGPPGTGKTLIGKCIASQSKSTFFCISASSLTSKWVGEGEKMVRALFAVARCHQPAVIFIDEVDSLLSQRSDGEHEASRRIKTEFLVQLDGATTESDDGILVIGATNRPQEIDEAARRRFVKRLYIPLPELVARQHIVTRLMAKQHCQLDEADVATIGHHTQGYSGADMANLCREAALGPIRSIPFEQIETIRPDQVPPITMSDFEAALLQVRPSVSAKDLDLYIDWNNTYGSFGQ